MLSGREQELAARLREAASQVIDAVDDAVDDIGVMLWVMNMMMIMI